MKAKTQPTIILEQIIQTINSHPLQIEVSRKILYKFVGASLTITGKVEKKITRHEHLKLLMRPELPDDKKIMVFAEFTDAAEADKIHAAKIRKGSKVSITGYFCTAGYLAATISNCRINSLKGVKNYVRTK